jgi:hypothetical protein
LGNSKGSLACPPAAIHAREHTAANTNENNVHLDIVLVILNPLLKSLQKAIIIPDFEVGEVP